MSDRVIKEIYKDDILVKFKYDDDPVHPRQEDCNLGTMICFHKRYKIGDKHNYSDPDEFWYDLLSNFDNEEIINYCLNIKSFTFFNVEKSGMNYTIRTFDKKHDLKNMSIIDRDDLIDELKNHLNHDEIISFLESKGWVILPVYMYDHSGQTISTSPFSCPWDSGLLGHIYISAENIAKEKITKEQAKEYLENEIKIYDAYMNGSIYMMTVYNKGELEDCHGNYYLNSYDDFNSMVKDMLTDTGYENMLETGNIIYE